MSRQGKRGGEVLCTPPFGTVQNPIHMMEAEHQTGGDEPAAEAKLTDPMSVVQNSLNWNRA